MALVTITEAAKLSGKSKQTMYRHIKAGKFSRRSDGLIDTTELIRVYGELRKIGASQSAKSNATVERVDTSHIAWLEQQIDDLRSQVKQVQEDAQAREMRLMSLLEHKIDTQHNETKPDNTGIASRLSKLFK